ncbi:hypothetical protein H8356DRAFT_1420214 [Neocallimastix lanati (nom. inval.)]|nr:hypothetical protein H8356DRAFT_1420214 [Neocallimastix sp. JGI-2020a]
MLIEQFLKRVNYSINVGSTNIIKDNYNKDSITSSSIKGTGINLSNNIKSLLNIEEVSIREIIYPKWIIQRIYKKGIYKGIYKNNHHSWEKIPYILKNNKLITSIHTYDENLYILNTTPIKDIDCNISNIDLKSCHYRLGRKENINCKYCKISKLMKNPFSKTNNKSTLPLQIVHTDIIGQFKLRPSFRHKFEAVQKFIEFHKFIKNNTSNYNIKENIINSNFINYFKNNGITFNCSTPGNPQQNYRSLCGSHGYKNNEPLDKTTYKCPIGMLKFLTKTIRSDISFVVLKAARNSENPLIIDYRKIKNILK